MRLLIVYDRWGAVIMEMTASDIVYLFDVDGTLTPAKSKMVPSFSDTFFNWTEGKRVYIVSGGSFERIVNQLGRKNLDRMKGVFACMGNVFYKNRESKENSYSEWDLVYKNKFTVDKEKLFFSELERYVMQSDYHTKTGRHYEERIGMINFSIVGRNATPQQRKEYAAYDKEHHEREQIVEKLKERHPKLDFVIGGAVSVDIFNIGNDKSQVVDKHFGEVLENNKIVFVGDRIPFPGNDCALAVALRQHPNGSAYEVEGWKDTAKLLKTWPFA